MKFSRIPPFLRIDFPILEDMKFSIDKTLTIHRNTYIHSLARFIAFMGQTVLSAKIKLNIQLASLSSTI